MRAELAVALLLKSALAWADEPATGTATLPLPEVLKLHEQRAESQRARKPAPPVGAVVNRVELSGRLLDDAMEVVADVDVTVLSDDAWITVPILAVDAATEVTRAEQPGNGALVTRDGMLSWVGREPGTTRFKVTLLKRARPEGRARRVQWNVPGATVSRLHVNADDALFRVINGGPREPDGVRIPGPAGSFNVTWETLGERGPVAEARAAPVEPVVTRAVGSSVSTLDGGLITRVHYELRFNGRRTLTTRVPPGQVLEKVYVNGVAVPFIINEGRCDVEVAPPRAGDDSGRLEMVLVSPPATYNLSGTRHFAVPAVSWPVNEVFLELHLPEVFTYEWTGGSMAPVETGPAVDFAYKVPTPGRKMSLHQYLVTGSAPQATVRYSVALDGQYFRR